MKPQVLALDCAFAPHQWLELKDAAHYYASELVDCQFGETEFELRGGIQLATGKRSILKINSIITLKGAKYMGGFERVPTLDKDMLLRRDRYTCAYCAQTFKTNMLDMEHILPDSRGGPYSWMNLVTACKACNDRKRDRTPEEAGMQLHYVPYVPNLFEEFILRGRGILADQMEFLKKGLPKCSRLRDLQ